MADMTQKLDAAMKDMWIDRPADVDRMVGRNFDTGKEFSVWAYTWGYLSNLSDLLFDLSTEGKKGSGDLETLKTLAARTCRRYADSLRHTAHLEDCAAMLDESADAFEALADHAGLAVLARALQRYLMQLSFWIDMELPWADVCELVHSRWHRPASVR